MALPIAGKILLDTNVLIDFLHAGMHAEWVLGGQGTVVRLISAVALLELRLGADTPKRKKAVDRLHQAFRSGAPSASRRHSSTMPDKFFEPYMEMRPD